MLRTSTGRHAALALATGLALSAATSAPAQSAEHVFVFVIDGLRASEGFDDPASEVVAPLLTQLAPQGSLLTGLDITGQTVTQPAHHALVTGTWSDYGGAPPLETRRFHVPRSPTIFEAYRRHSGAAQDSCWIVGNTDYIHDLTHSFMPGFGRPHGGSRAISYDVLTEDPWTWQRIDQILAAGEVDLMVVNIHETDRKGHAGEWENYMGRAGAAATGVVALWEQLQQDPVYAGNTAFLVTTDHGRHLDDVQAGWISHGCACRGCRSAFLVAVGPGIRAGFQSDVVTSLQDIAPTAAQLLGFQMPFARGRVLTEILEDGESLPRGVGGAFRPQLASAAGLHVRAYERFDPELNDDQGAHQVVAEASTDGGGSWTEVYSGELGLMQGAPTLWSAGDQVYLGWVEQFAGGDDEYSRLLRIDPDSLTTEDLFDHPLVSSISPIANVALAEDGQVALLAEHNPRNDITQFWTSDDGGSNWTESEHMYASPGYFSRDWSHLAVGEGAWVAVYSAHTNDDLDPEDPNDNTEIYVVRGEGSTPEWDHATVISSGPEPSIQPQLARTEDGVLHVVWADLASDRFQVQYARSTDDGMSFSAPVQLTDAAVAAWEPALAAEDRRLFLAWSQFDTPQEAAVHLARIHEDWLVDEQVVSAPGELARTPRLQPLGDCTALVAWSRGDLSSAWGLETEHLITTPLPLQSAEGSLEPGEITVGAGTVTLTLTLMLSVAEDDRGVDRVHIRVPALLSPGDLQGVAVDGDPVDATGAVDGQILSVELAEIIEHDAARIDVTFDVVPPDEGDEMVVFEVELEQGAVSCPVAASGDLYVQLEEAVTADDDDSSTSPPDNKNCNCRVDGAGPAGVALAFVLAAGLGILRRRR